jgi:type II secretory pathway pseudopilin PulG
MRTKYKIQPLTLVELLISLGILAAVASVTLSMLEESTGQQRFKRTYETGKKIREVINTRNGEDGISRFISDMGRLPVVISTAEGMRLAELYNTDAVDSAAKWSSAETFNNNDSSLPTADSSLDFPDDFVSLTLPCGWAGPYLYNHKTLLFDGWNNEWQILGADYNIAASWGLDTFIYGVESLGSNDSLDEDSWSGQRQKFKFNLSGTAAANKASLIVTIMVKDDSALKPLIVAGAKTENQTAPDWAADTEYKLNDEAKNGSFTFRCTNILINAKGKSGGTVPVWNTSAVGALTLDKNIVWQYYGTASEEADWLADCVYSKNDKVKANGYAFICSRVRPVSSSSAPAFNTDYKDTTNDADITWQCIYPKPSTLSHLRVAVFMPRISRTEKGIRRFMAIRENSTLTTDHENSISFSTTGFFDEMATETANWIAYNQVEIKNLTPGSRKLYVYGFFKAGSVYRNKRGSDVIDLELSPGVNRITVCLVNEL